MVMTSFSFSNCTEELSFASFFYTQFENSNDVIPCNKYEQITLSYPIYHRPSGENFSFVVSYLLSVKYEHVWRGITDNVLFYVPRNVNQNGES